MEIEKKDLKKLQQEIKDIIEELKQKLFIVQNAINELPLQIAFENGKLNTIKLLLEDGKAEAVELQKRDKKKEVKTSK